MGVSLHTGWYSILLLLLLLLLLLGSQLILSVLFFDVISGPSARDLSRMFPTPPSAEMPCSSMSSPMQAAETVTAEAIAMDVLHPHHFTSSTASLTSGRDDGAGSVGSLVLLRKVRLLGLSCKPGPKFTKHCLTIYRKICPKIVLRQKL